MFQSFEKNILINYCFFNKNNEWLEMVALF